MESNNKTAYAFHYGSKTVQNRYFWYVGNEESITYNISHDQNWKFPSPKLSIAQEIWLQVEFRYVASLNQEVQLNPWLSVH